MEFTPLPVPRSFLEQFWINARRQIRPNLVGGHITRRMGQSLEFREYAQYTLGDDVRHIDWRASARTAGNVGAAYWENLLVRTFVAEEHLKLVVSIDSRQTMAWPRLPRGLLRRPVNISKLQVARWIAEALSFIALRAGNQVVLHPLFGNPMPLRALRGTGSQTRIREELDRIAGQVSPHEQFNPEGLDQFLPPASVWVIVTDFYFSPDHLPDNQRLLHRIRTAKNKMRWVILIDLDSWPYERRELGYGARRLDGPGSKEKRLVVDDDVLAATAATISAVKRPFFNAADHTIWPWDTRDDLRQGGGWHDALATFFRRQFMEDRLLRLLFMRDA